MSDPKEPGQNADEPTSVFPTDEPTAVVSSGTEHEQQASAGDDAVTGSEKTPADEWTAHTPAGESGAYDATQVASSYVPPAYEPPTYQPPSYESSAYQSPSYETPSYESPSYLPPVYGAPSTSPQPEQPPADSFAAPDPVAPEPPQQDVYPEAGQYPAQQPAYPQAIPYAAAPGAPLTPYPMYPGYGQQPSGPQPETGQVSSIICLVISGLLTVSCYFTLIGLAPLILSIVALVKSNSVGSLWLSGQTEAAQQAADSSRSLALWAWLSMLIGFVVAVVVVLVIIAIAVNS